MKQEIKIKMICILFQALLAVILSSCFQPEKDHFVLMSGKESASVFILPGETEYVRLAVMDLISDVEKITGKKPDLISDLSKCKDNCVIIGTSERIFQSEIPKEIIRSDLESVRGKWESYLIKNYSGDKNYLLISGSDYRGTMDGIYHFTESFLGVDPLYFWSDREPEKRKRLSWSGISILQDEPAFRYRGWFINDEDLLTEWMDGAGPRYIEYPFYSQVTNPQIIERAVEALVRLRFNLIIPASFVDIGNPPEKQLVDIAARRGIFVSMHHIEPMGVSGFTFFNYWKAKRKDYKFSFHSHPEQMKEVWHAYAQKWADYPNVIWQIGLRGIADRPMWSADPDIPESDEFRGKLISDALKEQMEIIRSVDKRDNIPVSTTLWAEGSSLNKQGYLTFPEDVMVIFSDNSPGWMLQPDFYETAREPGRKYGIYYHQALWGTGPHLVQGIPPSKTYEIFKLATDKQSDEYAILNVSNIREFPLGLKASSEMLWNCKDFDPDAFLLRWCRERFGKAATKAEAVYRQFFDSYQLHGENNMIFLLDGQMKSKGTSILNDLKLKITLPGTSKLPQRYLSDSRAGNISFADLAGKVSLQKGGFEKTGMMAEKIRKKLDGEDLVFFEVNLIAQQKIILGITSWLEELIKAAEAENAGDRKASVSFLESALNAFDMIRSGQELTSRGDKWKNWYRGDKKMNLGNMEALTREVLEAVRK